MKEFIMQYVKEIGVFLLLSCKCFEETLTYYIIDWIDKDGKYYSLLAMCNDTQIFTKHTITIGEADTEVNPLVSNLRQFDCKNDWNRGRWVFNDVKKMDAFLKHSYADVALSDCDTENYKIIAFGVTIRPILQFIVSYVNGYNVRCLSLYPEKNQVLLYDSLEHFMFLKRIISQLNLTEYYRLEAATHV